MKYNLYDLEISVIGNQNTFNCSHIIGQTLVVKGENISFKKGTSQFSHYAISALIHLIAAKQRQSEKEDWMNYETDIACPDPQCGARFRFKRTRKTTYEYGV